MRLLIIVMFFSNALWAGTSEEVVKNYTKFISNPEINKIDLIFSKRFIKNFGGREKLNAVFTKAKKNKDTDYKIKKVGEQKDKQYVELSSGKHKTTYILKKEAGHFKIDGTIKSE